MFGFSKTSTVGIGLYLMAAFALYNCIRCGDCDKLQCIMQVLTGVFGGTGLMFAKDSGTTGGTVPLTVEAEKRTVGAGAQPVK